MTDFTKLRKGKGLFFVEIKKQLRNRQKKLKFVEGLPIYCVPYTDNFNETGIQLNFSFQQIFDLKSAQSKSSPSIKTTQKLGKLQGARLFIIER